MYLSHILKTLKKGECTLKKENINYNMNIINEEKIMLSPKIVRALKIDTFNYFDYNSKSKKSDMHAWSNQNLHE